MSDATNAPGRNARQNEQYALGQAKYQVRFDWGVEGARRILPGAQIVVLVDALLATTQAVLAAERGETYALPTSPSGVAIPDAAPSAIPDAAPSAIPDAAPSAIPDAAPHAVPTSISDAAQDPASALAADAVAALATHIATDPSPAIAPDVAGTVAADIAASLAGVDVIVLAASLRNREAVARRVLALQEARGERLPVSVVAAGEYAEPAGGTTPADSTPGAGGRARGIRFAIEDQLTAGAVIDSLVRLGIDHTSPEAAVACAAFEGLQHAAVHLIGASATGVELAAAGRKADARLATQRDVTDLVPVLRVGVFGA